MNNTLISIVSHQQFDLVKLLLRDLTMQNLDDGCLIILTINIPEDLTGLEEFCELPIKLVCNEQPYGFGENHNRAFNLAPSSFFLVMNPDIRINKNNFNLYEYVKRAQSLDAKIVAPVVTDALGRFDGNHRKYPTVTNLFLRFLGYERESQNSEHLLSCNEIFTTDWVAGMFVMYKSEAYKCLGGFDSRYFMYMEDVDICRRSELMYKVSSVVMPTFQVIHNAQRASRRKIKYLFWHIRSALIYFFF